MQDITWKPEACPIQSVVVYLQGAQIQRTGPLSLPAGESRVTLERLPVGLLPDSIQASLGDGAEILSVEHRVNHMTEAGFDGDIQRLREELEKLQQEQRHKQAMLQVCQGQEEMLAANRSMAGADTGLRAAELREGVGFFRECMEEIKLRQLSLQQEMDKLKRKISQIQGQLGHMSSDSVRPVSEIVLRITSAEGGDIPLNLTYFVGDAGWVPSYDIRARDTQSPIRVSCKARIAQSTGEDWEEVELTISTGSPSGNALCPELQPWNLDFERPHQFRGKASMYQSFNAASVRKSAAFHDQEALDEAVMERSAPVPSAAAMPEPEPVGAAVDRSLTTVDYLIPTPCTILSAQGEQMVEMVAHEVSASYQYRSVRKLDKEVYLMAKVRDYAGLNLVAGEANIFFGNKYVGKTWIDPRKGEEEIDWSLGSDPSVVVTRHKGKSLTAGGLGGSRKVTREWELTARNLKNHPIEIQLQDQVPVSVNKQIQVEVTEISGAEHNKDTGILKWACSLEPAEAKTFRVRYTVIHPKNTVVHLD